jgi:hypothetical protein
MGGDPLNTNSKMLILADHKKYNAIGDRSRYILKDEIVRRIGEILHTYQGEPIEIVTVNRKEARALEKALTEAGTPAKVDYYKSKRMIGVACQSRIMIAIGLAYKKANAFDPNTWDSKRMLHEAIHCDTYQAWSRVKDSEGKDPSLVFALGCCIEDCENVSKWGFDRTVQVSDSLNGSKLDVKVSCRKETITRPIICKCKHNKGMLERAALHKLPKVISPKTRKPSISYIIDGFRVSSELSLDSPLSFLNFTLNRKDTFCQQVKKGEHIKKRNGVEYNAGEYIRQNYPISEHVLLTHLSGRETIGAYNLNPENKVKWIMYDIDSHPPRKPEEAARETPEDINKRNAEADEKRDILCNFLTELGIPFILENSGSPHSYHVWVFVELVSAEIAYNFAHAIRKALNWKESEVEVYPVQKSISGGGYGNQVKLPFAVNQKNGGLSEVLIDGEFRRDFDSMKVSIIDISHFVLPVPEKPVTTERKKSPVNHVIRVNGKVKYRPRKCFLEALKKPLPKRFERFLVFAVRELHVAGFSKEEIIEFFRHQPIFDEDFTVYKIEEVLKRDISIPIPCKTVYQQAGWIVGCETCENFGACQD